MGHMFGVQAGILFDKGLLRIVTSIPRVPIAFSRSALASPIARTVSGSMVA